MQTSDVISVLALLGVDSRKTNYFIGPEQKYIGSLLNSGTRNLEENLKIGQNEIITRWYDTNCYRETIEFRTDDIIENYYIIEYYEYDTRPEDIDITYSNYMLTIDDHNKFGNYPNSNTKVQKYELYFQYPNTKELIAKKEVYHNISESNGICTDTITAY